MAGISITIRPEGADAVLAALRKGLERAENKRGMMAAIGASLVASTQQRFEAEASPDGSPWPASLRALVEGGRTLTDTSALVRSITFLASDDSVAVGTNTIYAAIHQTGGTIRAKTSKGLRFRGAGNGGWVTKQSVTMPARPFLGLDDEDEKEIGAIVVDWLGAEGGSGPQ